MMYRALYHSKAGRVRYFTFTHSGGHKAAHAFASRFAIGAEQLQHVETVRPLARPEYQLQAQLIT